jgi:hypothetical protein
VAGTDSQRRCQPFVSERRRHADVGDDHVGWLCINCGEQRVGIADRLRYIDAGFVEQAGEPCS